MEGRERIHPCRDVQCDGYREKSETLEIRRKVAPIWLEETPLPREDQTQLEDRARGERMSRGEGEDGAPVEFPTWEPTESGDSMSIEIGLEK